MISIKKIKSFINDKDGSESVEMVYSTTVIIAFILVALMFMSYIFALNNARLATRRICRDIETTGTVTSQAAMENWLRSHLPSPSFSDHNIKVSNAGGFQISNQDVEFLDTFVVESTCNYNIQIINPGVFTGYKIRLPITIRVIGMSEVKHTKS